MRLAFIIVIAFILAACSGGSDVNIQQTCGVLTGRGVVCEGTITRLNDDYTLRLGQKNTLEGPFELALTIGTAAGRINVIIETADGRRVEQEISPGNSWEVTETVNDSNGQAVVTLEVLTEDARSIGFNATLTR